MIKQFFVIAILAISLAISSLQASADATDLYVEPAILYTSKSITTETFPEVFPENPGTGVKMFLRHSLGIPNGGLTVGVHRTHMHRPWGVDEEKRATSAFISLEKNVGRVRLSIEEKFNRKSVLKKTGDFMQEDMYETFLKAGLNVANMEAQAPYVFTGLMVPAYVPLNKALVFCGVGFSGEVPINQYMEFHTDCYIATSAYNSINQGRETVFKTRTSVLLLPKNLPQLEIGFNSLQNMRRREQHIWWDISVSRAF